MIDVIFIPVFLCVVNSTNLLHGKKIIDQTMLTRHLLAQAVAHQFFTCFISMNSWFLLVINLVFVPIRIVSLVGCVEKYFLAVESVIWFDTL